MCVLVRVLKTNTAESSRNSLRSSGRRSLEEASEKDPKRCKDCFRKFRLRESERSTTSDSEDDITQTGSSHKIEMPPHSRKWELKPRHDKDRLDRRIPRENRLDRRTPRDNRYRHSSECLFL